VTHVDSAGMALCRIAVDQYKVLVVSQSSLVQAMMSEEAA